MEKSISNPIKIAVVGPESSGKTTLTKMLAKAFNTLWVPEYARTYLKQIRRPYTYDDLLPIAQGQMALEAEYTQKNPQILFCDTELFTIKIWSQHKYQRCEPWILEQCRQQAYQQYLVCSPDIPWEYDPLRENPHLGEFFLNQFIEELLMVGASYDVIKGTLDERVTRAKHIITQLAK